MDIEKKTNELTEVLQKARAISAKCETENRDFSGEERTQVANLLETAKGLKAEIKEAKGDQAMRQQIDAIGEGIEFINHANGNGSKSFGGQYLPRTGDGATIGEQFVNSAEWKSFMNQFGNGRIPDKAALNAIPVGFKSLLRASGAKDLLTGSGATSGGAFIVPDNTGIYESLGRYPTTMRQLVANRTTGSDTVEFVQQLTQVTQAAPVPESNVTNYTGATGEVSGQKPEGSMTFQRVSEPVKTVAVWIPATRRALSDAAQLRGLIDQELNEDLNEELEDQLLNGDGSGENFTGLYNTSGTLVQPYTTDIFTTTRKAITNLAINGKQRPSAWVIHPTDWETIELQKDGNNRYYYGGPLVRGSKQLWGVPVVESYFCQQGLPLLGNFSKAVLWDREEANLTVSDSHSDFFIRNMVAVLAEMRAAFGVIRPSAFVEVDIIAGT